LSEIKHNEFVYKTHKSYKIKNSPYKKQHCYTVFPANLQRSLVNLQQNSCNESTYLRIFTYLSFERWPAICIHIVTYVIVLYIT